MNLTPERKSLFQRLAWIQAYLAHYQEDPGEIFGALRADPLVYETLLEELRLTLAADRNRGDLELENRYMSELMHARTVLRSRKLPFDQVVVLLAVREADDLLLPDVVLAPEEHTR